MMCCPKKKYLFNLFFKTVIAKYTYFFRPGLTAEEMEAAQKRAEAETRAAEAAEKLLKEREILERKRQREEKMKEWVRKFLFFFNI